MCDISMLTKCKALYFLDLALNCLSVNLKKKKNQAHHILNEEYCFSLCLHPCYYVLKKQFFSIYLVSEMVASLIFTLVKYKPFVDKCLNKELTYLIDKTSFS